MELERLKRQWLSQERQAHIHGWDFSHIAGKYSEDTALGWDYGQLVRKYLARDARLLDIDTGGGEFLLSLMHPPSKTSATEGYAPNVALCRERFLPLGIDFRPAPDVSRLPFEDGAFDVVINRHGAFDARELFRVIRPGGVFITQQVGAENDRELVEMLLGKVEMPYPEQYLEIAARKFTGAGFKIIQSGEAFNAIRFFDVGALVWFAHIIEWEFPGFSVEACLPNLLRAQRRLEQDGALSARTHRFMLVAVRQ